MYAQFFGLSREPFSIAPDPRYLFMSERHREALAHLLYGVGGGGGFVLLTGEIGAGKTTVGRCFLEQVPAHCVIAYVFNPQLTVLELLQTVCAEFGVEAAADSASLKAHVDALNRFLLAAHAEGRQALLVIDEAQSLSAEVLEQLRLLTNLETAERKLMQIVLIGQPELRTLLADPRLEQLAQRVIARYHLGALSRDETEQYLAHRLSVAGLRGAMPFDGAARKAIHRLTGGVPRRINLLADRALLGAYAQGRQRVGRRTVEQAAREVFDGGPVTGRGRVLAAAAAASALLAVAAVGLWLWRHQADPPPAVAASTRPAAVPVGAASQAPAPAASAAPVPVVSAASSAAAAASAASDASALMAAARADPATAWRELALRWNVAIGEGDPCAAAEQARLACFSNRAGGLAMVRQLGRPGIVTLRAADGSTRHAVLLAVDERHATLQAGGERFVLTLPALAAVWRGDFATFWRTPPGWRRGADPTPEARAWIEQQLAAADPASPGRELRERVAAFQLVQGLPPDGVAGPMTLMLLNRAAAVEEPRLEAATAR
jgi:general secretion pathway protein A